MTDKPHIAAGDHTLRPDPLGAADPLKPAGPPAGDHTLHPDPAGLHDPAPNAAAAAQGAAQEAAASVKAGAQSVGDTVAAKAADLAEQARGRVADLASDVQERLGGAADDARQRAAAVYDDTRERVGAMHRRHMARIDDLTTQGVDGLNRGRTAVERFVDDNPLLVGVVGVAAGLLLGALLPRTRQEDRNLGPLADEVRDQGLRYAREMTSRGREFVQTALDPDNINAAARKVADTPPPPPGERAAHTL
jgi:ElaB/YqjD/DUF883 family membrane-anchored ribosome-binding protein